MYSKIKQGRMFVYHSTAHSQSHEKVTILAKHKVKETERRAYWKKQDREGKKPLYSQCFFITSILNIAFVFQKIPWLQKFKTLEKNEKIDCMLHCDKIEFKFLQKKFSKHLLHNIIFTYAYVVKESVSTVLLLE